MTVLKQIVRVKKMPNLDVWVELKGPFKYVVRDNFWDFREPQFSLTHWLFFKQKLISIIKWEKRKVSLDPSLPVRRKFLIPKALKAVSQNAKEVSVSHCRPLPLKCHVQVSFPRYLRGLGSKNIWTWIAKPWIASPLSIHKKGVWFH